MEFKDTLKKAQSDHKTKTGEVITDVYISALLWPDTYNELTRANSMSHLKRKGFGKSGEKLMILQSIFPNVPVIDWIK